MKQESLDFGGMGGTSPLSSVLHVPPSIPDCEEAHGVNNIFCQMNLVSFLKLLLSFDEVKRWKGKA